MVMLSQNKWGCITNADSNMLRWWTIGPVQLQLRTGPAGFVLAHQALWFHEEIERLWPQMMPDHDDHGWGQRYIGSTNVPSNHWSATAMDLNARLHPQGQEPEDAFTSKQVKWIRTRMETKYDGIMKWGGDFTTTPDPMHYELRDKTDYPASKVREVALECVQTPVGKRLIKQQSKPVLWEKW